jgi:hypothetical protein
MWAAAINGPDSAPLWACAVVKPVAAASDIVINVVVFLLITSGPPLS